MIAYKFMASRFFPGEQIFHEVEKQYCMNHVCIQLTSFTTTFP